jgi:hypothetical protein
MASISPEAWTAIGSVAGVLSVVIAALAWLRPRRELGAADVHEREAAQQVPTAPTAEEPPPKPRPAGLPDMHVERPRQRARLHPTTSGHELVSLINLAVVYEFSHHEPDGVEETELLAGFFDQIKELGRGRRRTRPRGEPASGAEPWGGTRAARAARVGGTRRARAADARRRRQAVTLARRAHPRRTEGRLAHR